MAVVLPPRKGSIVSQAYALMAKEQRAQKRAAKPKPAEIAPPAPARKGRKK